MDDVRKNIREAVAKIRPELPVREQRRVVDQVMDTIEKHNPTSDAVPVNVPANPSESSLRRATVTERGVPKPGGGVAFIVRCERNGTVKEVIQDALGVGPRLPPGAELTASVVSPFHLRRITRFFRSVRENRVSFDCAVTVLAPSGSVRLYCSGFVVGNDIITIATPHPLSTTVPRELGMLAKQKPEILNSVLEELAAWKTKNTNTGPSENPSDSPASVAQDPKDPRTGTRRRRLLELAAHDLRNPMSGILAACQYLLEDASEALEPHQKLVLYSIESSTQVALQLIQSLAEISSIHLGEPELDPRPTDIVSVLEQSVAAVRQWADVMKVKLQTKVKDQLPVLTVDPARLRETFRGIIVAGIGTSQGAGKIDIVVGRRAHDVVISLRREYTTPVRHPPPVEAGSTLPHGAPRRLSDLHASLLLARSKRILEAHGGRLRAETHGKYWHAWTVTLPMNAEQSGGMGG
jgi:signal transduction histidine kinase